MNRTTEVLVCFAAAAVIVGVAMYIAQHVHTFCFFGNCAAVVH